MKTKLMMTALAAGLLVSTPLLADDLPSVEETCAGYAQLAHNIMKQRQEGVSMADLMDSIESDPDGTAHALVAGAFDRGRYDSKKLQKRVIDEYENDVYSACYHTLN